MRFIGSAPWGVEWKVESGKWKVESESGKACTDTVIFPLTAYCLRLLLLLLLPTSYSLPPFLIIKFVSSRSRTGRSSGAVSRAMNSRAR